MIGALRAVIASPSAWALGAAGFLARGGIIVFALPIWSLPTPVGVTLLIPPVAVDTTGVSPEFLRELLALGALLAVLAAVALVTGALADVVAFGRLARVSRPAAPGRIGSATARLVLVEVLSLLPAIAAAVVAAGRLVDVGETEYLLPSSTAVPYLVRVVNGAWPQLAAVGACLVFADIANAVLSRLVLRRVWGAVGLPSDARSLTDPLTGGSGPSPSAGRAARGIARAVAAWLGGWTATAVFVLPGLAAIQLCWPLLRDAYAATLRPSPPPVPELVAVTVLVVAAWVGGVFVAGLGSAIRTAGWTLATVP